MEYARRLLGWIIPSADIRPAFWLFIFVSILALYDVVLVPNSTLQNRYFPMTFQAWMIAGQHSSSPHEL